jgi:hypothetical protein
MPSAALQSSSRRVERLPSPEVVGTAPISPASARARAPSWVHRYDTASRGKASDPFGKIFMPEAEQMAIQEVSRRISMPLNLSVCSMPMLHQLQGRAPLMTMSVAGRVWRVRRRPTAVAINESAPALDDSCRLGMPHDPLDFPAQRAAGCSQAGQHGSRTERGSCPKGEDRAVAVRGAGRGVRVKTLAACEPRREREGGAACEAPLGRAGERPSGLSQRPLEHLIGVGVRQRL